MALGRSTPQGAAGNSSPTPPGDTDDVVRPPSESPGALVPKTVTDYMARQMYTATGGMSRTVCTLLCRRRHTTYTGCPANSFGQLQTPLPYLGFWLGWQVSK